jgi:signal transduction histidine kinase/ActR/RegA family two-component response regulator
MPATKLLGAFSIAVPSADARMVVFRDDGVRLVGSHVSTTKLDEVALALRLSHPKTMEKRRFSDGSEHLVTLHDVPRFGLKVMVSRDLKAVLGEFRGVVLITAIGLVLFLLIMAVSVQLVLRAERRSAMAQQALQAQLSRASKLQSLGTLAGGVAHDFNNVLAAIVGFGEMAQDAAPPGSDQARQLDRVLQAAQRGKALIERILAFSHGGAHVSLVFELEPVLTEVLDLLAATLRANVVIERQLDAPETRLRGDPTQAFEAVMNLCTNAMQAMPAGGMLSVRLEHQTMLEPRVLSHSQLGIGRYAVLTVSDQGQGITQEVMEHLFEPFFTTRSAESGTGLGLAVVHGVVTEFGGAIDVHSQVEKGSTFSLYFPECTDPVDPVAMPAPPAPAGRGQTVLVVDDEPTLVALMEEMLKDLGYQAVGYTDPIDALQVLLDNPLQFAALITDEVMPGLTGTQLTQKLKQAFGLQGPHLPVLLVSGYGGALLAQRAVDAGVSKVLAKPLRRADLANALAALLH